MVGVLVAWKNSKMADGSVFRFIYLSICFCRLLVLPSLFKNKESAFSDKNLFEVIERRMKENEKKNNPSPPFSQ